MKKLLPLALLLLSSPAFATNWYVDVVNGGTRYSATNPTGQCNGQGSSPYVSGVNQSCPYNDERLLWNDPTVYMDDTWVIAGGDVVTFLNAGPTHATQAAGADNPATAHCSGIGPDCTSPPVPSGTLSFPTTFRGVNYAACTVADARGVSHPDPTKTSYLWGGGGSGYIFELIGSQHVVISCLDMTDHAACNSITISCSGLEWTARGIWSGNQVPATNGDITLNAVNIHGFQSRGIRGNIGGQWNLNAVDIVANGSAGWDLDPNAVEPSHNGIIEWHDGALSWNGCTEEYPKVHTIPIQPNGCTDQNNAGYGDGYGTPEMQGILSAWFDHVETEFNTQDGIDAGHQEKGTVKFTRVFAQGNMGGNLKAGEPDTFIAWNNTINFNCQRLSAAMTGAPAGYNNGLTNFCRAGGDGSSTNVDQTINPGGSIDIEFNTFTGYAADFWDTQCLNGPCTYTYTFSNNVSLGYSNPAFNSGILPGFGNNLPPTSQSKNLWYNLHACYANGTDLSPTCATNPNLVSQPASPIAAESDLDGFSFYPNTGSAVIHAGTYNASVPQDYYSVTRPNPPTVGAVEPSGTPTASAPTFSPVAGTYASTQSVTISSLTSGATLCYTSDGSTPTANGSGTCTHGTTYSTAVSVASSLTLKAVASKSGFLDSSVASASYTITSQVATPTASPVGGTFTSAQTVTLSDSTSGAVICYTTNGATPTTASAGTCGSSPTQTYSSALTISSTTTVKALGTKAANTDSAVMTQTYTINIPVVPSGTFTGSGTITGSVTIQ